MTQQRCLKSGEKQLLVDQVEHTKNYAHVTKCSAEGTTAYRGLPCVETVGVGDCRDTVPVCFCTKATLTRPTQEISLFRMDACRQKTPKTHG